jgi:hydroxymethylpyrimidine pyrophosphatase-like HAD family hydrolase
MSVQPYPPPNVAAIDVDGTLQVNNAPNANVIAWCKAAKARGMTLMLWSSRGKAYAQRIAEAFGVSDLFSVICSKPGFVLDDKGWDWTKYTKTIRTFENL